MLRFATWSCFEANLLCIRKMIPATHSKSIITAIAIPMLNPKTNGCDSVSEDCISSGELRFRCKIHPCER